jgi:hypothetical protein
MGLAGPQHIGWAGGPDRCTQWRSGVTELHWLSVTKASRNPKQLASWAALPPQFDWEQKVDL